MNYNWSAGKANHFFGLIRCHDFRVTFCTTCYEAGIKIKTLQAWMGHADATMIMDANQFSFKGYDATNSFNIIAQGVVDPSNMKKAPDRRFLF